MRVYKLLVVSYDVEPSIAKDRYLSRDAVLEATREHRKLVVDGDEDGLYYLTYEIDPATGLVHEETLEVGSFSGGEMDIEEDK